MPLNDSVINVNLLSCRGREMNTDLIPLFHVLTRKYHASVHTFTRDIEKDPSLYPLTPEILGSKGKTHYICNDIAMATYLPSRTPDYRQMLLATVNNMFFQLGLRTKPQRYGIRKNTLKKFSHIYAPNQLVYDLIQEHFIVQSNQHIEILPNPFIWRLNQKNLADKYYQEFICRFPQIAEKKILFIMLSNQSAVHALNTLEGSSFHTLMEDLPKDWCIITNSFYVLERAAVSEQISSEQILYIKAQYPLEQILYFSDLLITDLSFFAAAQAGRQKAFYCINHCKNPFEEYMHKKEPALFLQSAENFHSIDYDQLMTPAHEAFYKKFTVPVTEDPGEKILEALMKK